MNTQETPISCLIGLDLIFLHNLEFKNKTFTLEKLVFLVQKWLAFALDNVTVSTLQGPPLNPSCSQGLQCSFLTKLGVCMRDSELDDTWQQLGSGHCNLFSCGKCARTDCECFHLHRGNLIM